jgi:hypothetical protein
VSDLSILSCYPQLSHGGRGDRTYKHLVLQKLKFMTKSKKNEIDFLHVSGLWRLAPRGLK